MPAPHPDLWRAFLPAPTAAAAARDSLWNAARDLLAPRGGRGPPTTTNDARVRFADPAVGARRLLESCGVLPPPSSSQHPPLSPAESETLEHLTAVLARFQSVAAPPDGPRDVACAARVVATIGPAGAKAPIWHADYVPVRLILGLVGPGCECLPEAVGGGGARVADRAALNNLDEDDPRRANDRIVPPAALIDAEERCGGGGDAPVLKRAAEGEAVLLVGREWEDDAAVGGAARDDDAGRVLAAVHRSPALAPGQERILLTVDLADYV